MFTTLGNAVVGTTVVFGELATALIAFSAPPDTAAIVQFLSSDGRLIQVEGPIEPEQSTYFVVPGFRSEPNCGASLRQAKAIHERFPAANVVVVAWQVPSKARGLLRGPDTSIFRHLGTVASEVQALHADYCRSVVSARQIGREIALWMKSRAVQPSRTVISGHSLGAQIAAFASNECSRAKLFNEPIGAIIAADPPGLHFNERPVEDRLDKDDARQVIVVHATDVWGDGHPIGTVDIYIEWNRLNQSNSIWQHSQARELITASFLSPTMSNRDGTPFGANALGFDFSDGQLRYYRAESDAPCDPVALLP